MVVPEKHPAVPKIIPRSQILLCFRDVRLFDESDHRPRIRDEGRFFRQNISVACFGTRGVDPEDNARSSAQIFDPRPHGLHISGRIAYGMICRECQHHSFGIPFLDVESAKSQRRGRIAADRFHNKVFRRNLGQLPSSYCEMSGTDGYQHSFRRNDRLNSGHSALEQRSGTQQRNEGLGNLRRTEGPEPLSSSACHDYRI